MGNQAGGLLTGKKDFPYEIGRQYADTYLWKIYEGKKKTDQQRVTIFSFEITKDVQPEKLDLARNTFKRMRAIRHPAFVTYLDGVELSNMIYIVTDYVIPLAETLRLMYADFGFNEAVSWGVYSVIQGLIFLHSKRLYHGNINAQSIYVDQAGEWKIGELGFLSEVLDQNSPQPVSPNTEVNTYGFPMKRFYNYLVHKYKSPELMSQRWDVVSQFPDRVDSFGVGCLLFEVFEGSIERTQDLKRITNKMPKSILGAYNQLIMDNPTLRLTLSAFLDNNYFNNTMVETCLFLENLSLKDPITIETFMTNLPDLLDALPKSTCKYKILPLLINAIKFGSGGAKAIHPIFKISQLMNEQEFKSAFIPKILDLFESNDRNVRINLLKNLGMIMPHLTPEHVEEKIYPNIAKGFTDTAPVLREMTIKSMIDIAPKLASATINDSLIRNLWNLQADKEASIRTNTVIAIGKLASYLDEKTRKKVLLAAFARSLRDPFLHSRLSSLRALLATKEYYSVRDVSTKLLPVVTPLLVDPERGVRDLAVQCTNTFLSVVTSAATSNNFEQFIAAEEGTPITGQSEGGTAKSAQSDSSSSYYNWGVNAISSGVSAVKSKVIGEGTPPPIQHAPTSGYGAEPAYQPPPPRKQLKNPDLFNDVEIKKPKDSLVLEHKKTKPVSAGWEDEDPFPKSTTSNSFYDDDGDIFGESGSGWDTFEIKPPPPSTKIPTKISVPKQQGNISDSTTSTKPPKPNKSSNLFDNDSLSAYAGTDWDVGDIDATPVQPNPRQNDILQPKKASSQIKDGSMKLRTEHRPSAQPFQVQNDVLQPKKVAPAKSASNKKKGKDELDIDWDAF